MRATKLAGSRIAAGISFTRSSRFMRGALPASPVFLSEAGYLLASALRVQRLPGAS